MNHIQTCHDGTLLLARPQQRASSTTTSRVAALTATLRRVVRAALAALGARAAAFVQSRLDAITVGECLYGLSFGPQ